MSQTKSVRFVIELRLVSLTSMYSEMKTVIRILMSSDSYAA